MTGCCVLCSEIVVKLLCFLSLFSRLLDSTIDTKKVKSIDFSWC